MNASLLRISLVVPAVALVGAVALQGTHLFREVPKPRDLRLDEAVPIRLEGWDGHDVPLGANEFQSNAVEKVLNYDQVIYREYRHDQESFGVYVAYWGAGKMPTRFVASHTPDRCWTENGWHCVEMKFREGPPPTSSTGTWWTASSTTTAAGSTRCRIRCGGGRTRRGRRSSAAANSSSSG